MSKQTAGIWRKEGFTDDGWLVVSDHGVVAEVFDGSSGGTKEASANADAIAAVPALIVNLRFLTEAAEMEPGMQIYRAHIERARQLLEFLT